MNYDQLKKIEQPAILRVIVSTVMPFILTLGIYIVFNGHLSPGGGFSGGAVLGGGLSLYMAAYGPEKVRRFFTFNTFRNLSCGALLVYALLKSFAFFQGNTGSEGARGMLGTPGTIFSGGLILPLNICVGIVVGCTVYGLFALFSESEV